MRRTRALLALLLCLFATPARAAAPPSLRIWSANDRGTADLFPAQRATVVIELRSEELHTAFAQHLTPDGLELEQASASSGTIVTDPFVSWTGEVSRTQPVNLVLTYRVAPDAAPGDRVITAQAQIAGHYLYAAMRLRVCCVPAPPPLPPGGRVYLPLIWR
jgi:hypothetical protein